MNWEKKLASWRKNYLQSNSEKKMEWRKKRMSLRVSVCATKSQLFVFSLTKFKKALLNYQYSLKCHVLTVKVCFISCIWCNESILNSPKIKSTRSSKQLYFSFFGGLFFYIRPCFLCQKYLKLLCARACVCVFKAWMLAVSECVDNIKRLALLAVI